jgi:hypothetical protein
MTMEALGVVGGALGDEVAAGTSAPMRRHVTVDARSEAPMPPFEVDGSAPSSSGARIVSRRAFARGDAVWPLSGRPAARSERTIQVGPTAHVEDESGLTFLRHSCAPNVVVDTSALLMVFALRDIAVGEELTRFYPSTEWDMVRPLVCGCGAPHCVRFVAGARYLSADVLGRHFVNEHIRRLLTAAVGRSWRP